MLTDHIAIILLTVVFPVVVFAAAALKDIRMPATPDPADHLPVRVLPEVRGARRLVLLWAPVLIALGVWLVTSVTTSPVKDMPPGFLAPFVMVTLVAMGHFRLRIMLRPSKHDACTHAEGTEPCSAPGDGSAGGQGRGE